MSREDFGSGSRRPCCIGTVTQAVGDQQRGLPAVLLDRPRVAGHHLTGFWQANRADFEALAAPRPARSPEFQSQCSAVAILRIDLQFAAQSAQGPQTGSHASRGGVPVAQARAEVRDSGPAVECEDLHAPDSVGLEAPQNQSAVTDVFDDIGDGFGNRERYISGYGRVKA